MGSTKVATFGNDLPAVSSSNGVRDCAHIHSKDEACSYEQHTIGTDGHVVPGVEATICVTIAEEPKMKRFMHSRKLLVFAHVLAPRNRRANVRMKLKKVELSLEILS